MNNSTSAGSSRPPESAAAGHVPTIALADVHAVLVCYFDHVAEIQEEIRAERALGDEFRRNHPSRLEAKLRRERLEEAS